MVSAKFASEESVTILFALRTKNASLLQPPSANVKKGTNVMRLLYTIFTQFKFKFYPVETQFR